MPTPRRFLDSRLVLSGKRQSCSFESERTRSHGLEFNVNFHLPAESTSLIRGIVFYPETPKALLIQMSKHANRLLVVVATVAAFFGVADANATAQGTSLSKGVYVGAAKPSRVAAFDATTRTHSTIASDFLPADGGWTGMDGAGGSDAWLLNKAWSGTSYQLSLGVPIIPSDSSGNPVGTLAQGATGAYNSYFVTLAQTLIAAGESNAYLRLGWEFDTDAYPWEAKTHRAEANFAKYFGQIVIAMRSVRGENFKFVWNPDATAFTQAHYNVGLAWPGRSYVDAIGLDAYDQVWLSDAQSPANAWNESLLPALNAAHQFAAAQGKPLAITEWGAIIRPDGHGLGDDPTYIDNMISWMHVPTNDVIFESYFDFDADGLNSFLTGGQFPNSLAAFRANGHDGGGGSNPWLPLTGGLLIVVLAGWMTRRARRTTHEQQSDPSEQRERPPENLIHPVDRRADSMAR